MLALLAMLNFAVQAHPAPTLVGSAILKTEVKYEDLEKLTPRAKSGKTQYWGQGSGFFVDSDGKIVTNYHVIENAEEVVAVWRGTAYRAETVAVEKDADLALLQFPTVMTSLSGDIDFAKYKRPISPALGFAKENECEVGDTIYVVGYPNIALQGMEAKVTKGIVSSMSGFKGGRDRFQMDAAIQGGNSGGPVVNDSGCLVGVSVSSLVGGENVNYAIKVSAVEKFLAGKVKLDEPPSPKRQRERNVIRNAVVSSVLVLNYVNGSRPRPYDDETKSLKERNEMRAQYEKTILYVRLLKVHKEWKDLKKLTDRLMKEYGENMEEGEIKELNALAAKMLDDCKNK